MKIVKCLQSTSSNSLFIKKENLKIYQFHKISLEIRSLYIHMYSVRYVNISWCTQPTTLLINQWGGLVCTSEVNFTSSFPFSITVHKQNCCTVVQSLRCRVTQKLWDTNGTGLSLQRKITKIITCSHPCSLYFEGNPIRTCSVH